ncbi:hypothetical protein AJ79_03902 [Helicocarpus griseus UAMH5409]|uniref:Uncharacterized protein n=1 Tax=Helicocarpus griseus UAMH5409 TaxID=1447875 RepID=A0A2B7XVT8_9EURO|nr:hypothetical protein AJ79_03902 [Helicocarpus griseus UAMH5409]
MQALRDPLLLPRQHLVDRAGREWTGDLMTLKGALIRIIEYWDRLPDTAGFPCPISFSKSELENFEEMERSWFLSNTLMNHWREELGGVSEDGWISHEKYPEAISKVQELKEQWVAAAEGDAEDLELLNKGWPFRDFQEDN